MLAGSCPQGWHAVPVGSQSLFPALFPTVDHWHKAGRVLGAAAQAQHPPSDHSPQLAAVSALGEAGGQCHGLSTGSGS